MTNLEKLSELMAYAADAQLCADVFRSRVNECTDELDEVAYCDITDPAHDDELARRYDHAAHELQRALADYDRAIAIRDEFRAQIMSLIDDGIRFAIG